MLMPTQQQFRFGCQHCHQDDKASALVRFVVSIVHAERAAASARHALSLLGQTIVGIVGDVDNLGGAGGASSDTAGYLWITNL